MKELPKNPYRLKKNSMKEGLLQLFIIIGIPVGYIIFRIFL